MYLQTFSIDHRCSSLVFSMSANENNLCAPELISHLEDAANICLGPPDVVSMERRREAEEVFVSFKKLRNPFGLCKYVLETCRVDYVLYQTAVLLREALTREWKSLAKSDVDQMLNYLLNFVIEKDGLQSYVKQQVLQVIAILVKRGSIEGWNSREEILNKVSQLISSGNMSLQLIGCSILSNLLLEFSSTFSSSDIGISWETHFQAKRDFEATHLKTTFEFCVQILLEVENVELTSQLLTFLKAFLGIAEQILSWNFLVKHLFLPRKIISVFEADQAPFLRPGAKWRSLLLDEKIIQLFYKIHWRVRNSSDVAHHSLNCLIQLATLNGAIFPSSEARTQYLTTFLSCFLNSFASNELFEHEILGTVAIFNKIVMVFPPNLMLSIPSQILKPFLSKITTFTCHTACAAAKEEVAGEDERVYCEGFDRLLESWSMILNDGTIPLEEDGLSAMKVFDTYLMCHLSPPQGTRPIHENEGLEEMKDFNEDDRSKYRDQLYVIGMISRRALPHTLPLLIKLLEERTNLLNKYFQQLAEQQTCVCDQTLTNLYEDIQWLILLTGNTLFAQSDTESNLIPSEIVKYSIQQAPNVDVGVSLQVLTSPHVSALEIDKCEAYADRLIRLISAIFRLCHLEKKALGWNLFNLLSPELSSTLVWFFEEWSQVYLLPNEAYYAELSPVLCAAFGRDSAVGQWVLRFLLDLVVSNLTTWDSETAIVDGTVSLLLAVGESRERCISLLKLENATEMITCQLLPNLTKLSKSAKKNMMKVLVLIASSQPNISAPDSLLIQLLQPLKERWAHVASNATLTSNNFRDHNNKLQMIYVLESLTGVVRGSDSTNSVCLFHHTHPIINDCVTVIDVYRNYQDVVETVLEFYVEATKRLLCFLPQSESQCLYSSCLSCMKVFANNNIGRQSRECAAEDEQFQDISLLIELLTNLLSKDFFDFGGEEQDGVLAADVALSGLDIVMPLMSVELLQFPRLCTQYFKLVTFVCELHPEKVCQMSENLQNNLFASVHLAFHRFGYDIISLCLDFLAILATFILKTNQRHIVTYQLIKPFVKIVIDFVLLDTTDYELIGTAGSALYPLIGCHQEYYAELMGAMLSNPAWAEHNYRQRFIDASNQLMDGINFSDDRALKKKFQQQFEKFILEVRGFLCVK